MERLIENNQIIICGRITEEFSYNHEVFGERFYESTMEVMRTSGKPDFVPIMVSERLVPVHEQWAEKFCKITGNFRSYNKHIDERTCLILSVYARTFDVLEEREDKNEIFLDGHLCKQPVYRETPMGREIADMLVAVNRPYGKSDYIPCVAWGRNAKYVSSFDVATHVNLRGRIQSREYIKKFADGTEEKRTAYEVSCGMLEIVEEMEE